MFMPVPVYSGPDAVMIHKKEIAALGKRALIVTGGTSSKKNGALADVINALEAEELTYTVFDGIEENPSVETVLKASAAGAQAGADFVIGIGGGSPMDAAKAAAFMMAHPGADRSLLYTAGDDSALPLVLVPTTCGTGSETTPYSVLTLHDRQTKKSISHRIFADLALVDGKYLRTAPLKVLRNTAIDALGHMIESYINPKADDFSRMFVDGGLDLWRKNISVLEKGGASDAQLLEMLNASSFAGMAITETSTGLPHALSYALTYRLSIPHGQAVGYFLAGFLDASPEKYKRHILDRLGLEDVRAFARLYNSLCGDIDIPDELLENSLTEISSNSAKLSTAPFETDREVLRRIIFYNKA